MTFACSTEVVIRELSGTILTNYQICFELNESNFDFDKVQPDGRDIRFQELNGTPLPYWTEFWDKPQMKAKIWIRIPCLPADSITNIEFLYEDSSASDASDGDATFEFFDSFVGTEIDTNKWIVTNGTGFSVSNGFLHGTNTTGRLTSKSNFSSGIIQEIKAKTTGIATNGQMIGGFYISSSNNIGWLNHPGSTYYRTDGSWIRTGTQTPANNMLYTIKVKDTSIVNLQMYNLDTSAMFWNVGDVSNAVSNEPIVLGMRYDNGFGGQGYVTDWDWIFVRKYSSIEPTVFKLTKFESIGWNYTDTLLITEKSGEDLSMFQVCLNLTEDNFDFSKAQIDGDDIRFADTDLYLVSHWIKSWDHVAKTAEIWIKVLYLFAGEETSLYLFYGNTEVSSGGSKNAVFNTSEAGTYIVTFSDAHIASNYGATCDGTNFYISQSGYVNRFNAFWIFKRQYSSLDIHTGICWDEKNKCFYGIDWSNKQWSAFDTSFVESTVSGLHDMFVGGQPVDCATDGEYIYTNHRHGLICRNKISDNSQDCINMDTLAGFNWGGQGITYAFGYIFAGTSPYGVNSNRIYIIDISDWNNPVIKSFWNAGGHELSEVAGLAHKDKFIYQTDRSHDYALKWQGPLKYALIEPTIKFIPGIVGLIFTHFNRGFN